jgi:hypothetical protein
MYLEVNKDPKRDSKFGIIIVLMAVVFFMLAAKCTAQCVTRSKPYAEYPTVTRILSCNGIGYEANDKSIFIGVFADSVTVNSYVPILYVFTPKSLKLSNPKLLITFEDGKSEELIAFVPDSLQGYAEFTSKDPHFNKLKTHKIDFIDFVNDEISYPVYESKMYVFYDFMASL